MKGNNLLNLFNPDRHIQREIEEIRSLALDMNSGYIPIDAGMIITGLKHIGIDTLFQYDYRGLYANLMGLAYNPYISERDGEILIAILSSMDGDLLETTQQHVFDYSNISGNIARIGSWIIKKMGGNKVDRIKTDPGHVSGNLRHENDNNHREEIREEILNRHKEQQAKQEQRGQQGDKGNQRQNPTKHEPRQNREGYRQERQDNRSDPFNSDTTKPPQSGLSSFQQKRPRF